MLKYALLLCSIILSQSALAKQWNRTIDFPQIYKNQFNPNQNKTFQLTLGTKSNKLLSSRETFTVSYGNKLAINYAQGTITIRELNPEKNTPSVPSSGFYPRKKINRIYQDSIHHDTKFVSLLFEINPSRTTSVQILEMDGKRHYLNSSPIYSVAAITPFRSVFGGFSAYSPSTVSSLEQLKITSGIDMYSMSFATRDSNPVGTTHHHTIRSLYWNALKAKKECWLPIMQIANYVLQTNCNLVDKTLHYLSGTKQQPKKTASSQPKQPTNTPLTWQLHDQLLTGKKNPYAVYAASKVCQVSPRFVISHRKPRGDDLAEAADCTYRLLSVITLYLDFAGNHFDQQRFNTTIDTILRTGSTGTANNDPAAEQALIDGVMAWRSEIQQNRAQLRQAFQEAAQLNASTVGFATGQFGTEPSTSSLPPSTTLVDYQTTLDDYELNLTNTNLEAFRLQYPEVLPRIRRNNDWVSSNDTFTVDIVDATIAQASGPLSADAIANILKQWYPSPSIDSSSSNNSSDSDSDTELFYSSELLTDGYEVADDIIRKITKNKDNQDGFPQNNILIIVRHQGRPVAMLLAALNREQHTAEVRFVVSHPDNLRTPYASSAIRGAGQRALQRFIEYALAQNIRIIKTSVITNRSAAVKKKFGFNLKKNEL